MATTSESLAFDRGVRPMLQIFLREKADAVIGFQADPDLQARIEELARKSTAGEFTEDERAEYAGYLRATSSSPFSNDKRSRSPTHVIDDQCTDLWLRFARCGCFRTAMAKS
jgi:uncharacterized protein YnzC (UPF0291/DUF896 family)